MEDPHPRRSEGNTTISEDICGFSGTGFKIGSAVGACTSEPILDGEATTVDVSPFSIDRFAEGRPLKGEHEYDSIWR